MRLGCWCRNWFWLCVGTDIGGGIAIGVGIDFGTGIDVGIDIGIGIEAVRGFSEIPKVQKMGFP